MFTTSSHKLGVTNEVFIACANSMSAEDTPVFMHPNSLSTRNENS